MKYDVIIIGAGASGLMAMKELVAAGYTVCLLEATATTGGRCHTLSKDGFPFPAEAGAEFIHGNAELTFEIIKQAGIPYEKIEGKMQQVQNTVWFHEETRSEQFDKVTEKLAAIETDSTIIDFLDDHFPPGEYDSIRKAVQRYAEGFGLADIKKASAFALREEWEHQNDDQYRITGGYVQLIDHLFGQCNTHKNPVHFFSPAYKIEYNKGNVQVFISHGRVLSGSRIIITVSAGVLQSGNIQITNLPPAYENAIQGLGFGSVIKVLFYFKNAFWQEREKDLSFLLTDEKFPTWWTQFPSENSLLTGWIGGPEAVEMSRSFGSDLYEIALSSVSNIFKCDKAVLSKQLIHHKISCWDTLNYIKGGYSYSTMKSKAAIETLSAPVDDCIYFAGEAIYTGNSTGTVEAALQSGKKAAEKIIAEKRS